MIDTPNISQPSTLHQEDSHGNAKTPFGLRAACTVLAITAAILAFIVFQRNSLLIESRSQLAQANAEATQTKGDLTGAKAQSASLQAQLDKDKSQQADLSAQMGKLQTDQKALQGQIKTLQDGRSSLQSELTNAKAETTNLQSRLSQSEDRATALSKQLDAANSESADLRSQLDKAQANAAPAQPAAMVARTMPISTSFEKAFMGGYTLHVSNLDPAALKVTISVGATDKTPIVTTIASGARFDVKRVAAGSSVVIAGDGYQTVNLTAR